MRKSFRSPSGRTVEVLRGVSFAARGGEMLAVTGASGAGKSTLLHLLGGLEAADDGSIEFDGFDVARASLAELARFRAREVGYVFQFHHLLTDLTAAENAAMPLLINRVARREAIGRAESALERVGLTKRAEHAVGDLSGGEQQRVAVARALVSGPSLLLADEPTGNLDDATGEAIGAALRSYCREQSAIIIIATHQRQLAKMCDRILFLEGGELRELAI